MSNKIKVQRKIFRNGRSVIPNLPRLSRRRRRSNVPQDDEAYLLTWLFMGAFFLLFTVMAGNNEFWVTVFGAIFLVYLIPFFIGYPIDLFALGKSLMKNSRLKLDLKQTIVGILGTIATVVILFRFMMWFQFEAWYIGHTSGISSPFLIITIPFALFIVLAFIKGKYMKNIANIILVLGVISNILLYLIRFSQDLFLHSMWHSHITLMFGIPFLICVIPLAFFNFALIVVTLGKRKKKKKIKRNPDGKVLLD